MNTRIERYKDLILLISHLNKKGKVKLVQKYTKIKETLSNEIKSNFKNRKNEIL